MILKMFYHIRTISRTIYAIDLKYEFKITLNITKLRLSVTLWYFLCIFDEGLPVINIKQRTQRL